MKVVLHPEADAEFLLAQQRYTDASPLLGRRFYEEVTSVFRQVVEHPLRFKQFDPASTTPIRQCISLCSHIRRKTRRRLDHRRHARQASTGLLEGSNGEVTDPVLSGTWVHIIPTE